MTDLSLLSWVQLARASPAAPWLWLCQAMSSWVGRGNSSGGVYLTSPGCRKAQLYLLFLSRVRKSVGNHVQNSPQIHSLISAKFWQNILQLPATGKLRVKLPSHSWAGVSLGSCFQEWTRVFFFSFLIQNHRWHNHSHQFQLCYFVEITKFQLDPISWFLSWKLSETCLCCPFFWRKKPLWICELTYISLSNTSHRHYGNTSWYNY